MSGAYSAQSLTANAQRAVNLYPEKNPQATAPNMPMTHYPRPGLTQLGAPANPGAGRCLYPANNGDLYAVVDQSVYYVDPDFTFHLLGSLLFDATTPVSMADNGSSAIIVDGSGNGYEIVFPSAGNPNRIFAEIGDPNFYGSPRADFIDSFLVLSRPSTNQWYSTESDIIVPFNPLFIGIKTAWPDNIVAVITVEREVYVLGPKKSEVWYNAGGVPFPFNILPGNIIEQGCAATYSPAKMDTNIYWLSQTPEGDRMVMRANSQNVAQRISTHAIEAEWRTYARIDDAIGSTYQISGHSFYRLHFPTADKTWVFDESIGDPAAAWHEEAWTDNNGARHRVRDTFNAFAYGRTLGLDWNTGALYQIDPQNATDNGQAIVCIRAFPHVVKELMQLSISSFTADVATGTSVGTAEAAQYQRPWSAGFSSGFGPLTPVAVPEISLRVSRDGGHNFGNNRIKQLISSGRYRTMQRWRGIGIARDTVFELSFTAAAISALNGGYYDGLQSGA